MKIYKTTEKELRNLFKIYSNFVWQYIPPYSGTSFEDWLKIFKFEEINK